MVIDLKACKCGEHRFATHEDCFLERRLLERREELALQAMLGMLLWPPVKRRGGGIQECRVVVIWQLQSKNLLIILGIAPADQQQGAAQPPAKTSDKVPLLFCCM